MRRGVDVSRIQGVLTAPQWRQTGLDFVILRCGTGNGQPDPTFVQNMCNARTAGLAVGAYHVGYPLPLDPSHPGRGPEEQARSHFMSCGALGQLQGTLPPALDLEWPEPKDWKTWGIDAPFILDWTLRYLATCLAQYQRTPMLYLYPDYWHHLSAAPGSNALARYPLWLAAYEVAVPPVLAPWTGCTMWQSGGGTGRLPNGAPVDEDVFLGDDAEWDALLSG